MSLSPEELLTVDLDGRRRSFDDVVANGLDRDYSARYPALRELIANGEPRHRVFAAAMLASWGVRDGYLAIVDWAADPDAVPWKAEPAARDRFTGVDSSFAVLAHALDVVRDMREISDATALLRVGAAHALLGIYDRVFFDRELYVVYDIDDELAQRSKAELAGAIDRAIRASANAMPFDMASQAAFLVGPFARLDDEAAARQADALLALHRDNSRVAREVALAMASGTGPATLTVLERMAMSTTGSVRSEVDAALARRRDPIVS